MYSRLTAQDREALRTERIVALEADHFRTVMLIAELPPDAPTGQHDKLAADMADYTRRIAVHLAPEPEPDPGRNPRNGVLEPAGHHGRTQP